MRQLCKWSFKINLKDDCAGIVELSDECYNKVLVE